MNLPLDQSIRYAPKVRHFELIQPPMYRKDSRGNSFQILKRTQPRQPNEHTHNQHYSSKFHYLCYNPWFAVAIAVVGYPDEG